MLESCPSPKDRDERDSTQAEQVDVRSPLHQ